MPRGGLTKSEGRDCLFLWICQMFLKVSHSWQEAFSPERDRMPCSCFCGQTHWALRLYHQQAPSYISDHVHWLFTSGSFSCCFPSLIRYYLWALVRERAISPPSAPSVHVTSRGWQQHSSFGIHLQQGKTRQNVKASTGRHTSEEGRKRARLSVGEGVAWENLRVLDKDWDTSGNKWMGARS